MYKAIIKPFVISLMALTMSCSGNNFHVKVVDQYGEPVSNVEVVIGSLTVFIMAVGSETNVYMTDEDGRFKIGGPRIDVESIEKNGYEFSNTKGFGSTSIDSNFKRDQDKNSKLNPYYILAWKRQEPEPLIGSHSAKGFTLQSSDQYLNVIFSKEGIRYKPVIGLKPLDEINGDLLIHYKETEEIVLTRQGREMHPWELTLAVPQGGLIETDDIIRNLAPEEGYQQTWTTRSTDFKHVEYGPEKTFYLKAKNGQVYGQFSVRFSPEFRSFGIEPYWLNPNGSRNLTRPKKYVYCKSRFSSRDCSLDDYGP